MAFFTLFRSFSLLFAFFFSLSLFFFLNLFRSFWHLALFLAFFTLFFFSSCYFLFALFFAFLLFFSSCYFLFPLFLAFFTLFFSSCYFHFPVFLDLKQLRPSVGSSVDSLIFLAWGRRAKEDKMMKLGGSIEVITISFLRLKQGDEARIDDQNQHPLSEKVEIVCPWLF